MLATFNATLIPEQEQLMVGEKPLYVEANLMQNRRGYLVSLVNSAIQEQSSQFVHTEEVAPASDIHLSLRIPQGVVAVRFIPEGTELKFSQAGGKVSFTVPRLEIHTAVEVQTNPRE